MTRSPRRRRARAARGLVGLRVVIPLVIPLIWVAPPARADLPLFDGNIGGSREGRRLLQAQRQYEAEKKNPYTAFGLEALWPGLGNHYAGENDDALLTWTGMVMGAAFLLNGSGKLCDWFSGAEACPGNDYEIVMGWIFIVGSRVYGLTGAPMNVVRNNRALRARLGLPQHGLRLAPLSTAGTGRAGRTYGLSLQLAF